MWRVDKVGYISRSRLRLVQWVSSRSSPRCLLVNHHSSCICTQPCVLAQLASFDMLFHALYSVSLPLFQLCTFHACVPVDKLCIQACMIVSTSLSLKMVISDGLFQSIKKIREVNSETTKWISEQIRVARYQR